MLTTFRTKGIAGLVMASGMLLAGQAVAQIAAATRTDLTSYTARAVTRLSLLDLRAIPSPLPSDFAITHELLGIAQGLAPDDAEIVRRRIETAWNAGNHASLMDLTATLVRLDPSDTVAQLRLITSRLRRLQTVRERLDAYAVLLGPRGAGIDPSVRSRLALDAALLAREQGDERGFIERLKESLRLDSTNKDAALLALSVHTSRSDDTRARLELISNLLLADPLDTKTIRMLRDEFATGGAMKAALRFHVLERQILMKAGQSMDTSSETEGFVLDWMVTGAEGVVKALTTQVEAQRAKVRHADELDPTRRESPNALRPEDIRLDLPFEQVRALALASLGETSRDRLRDSVVELEKTVHNKIQAFADPLRRPTTMTEEAAIDAAGAVLLELHLLRMLTGFETPEQLEELGKIEAALPAGEARAIAAARWRAVVEGRYADAAEMIPESASSMWARLARGEALAKLGAPGQAARVFEDIAREVPLSPTGAWARFRMGELTPSPSAETATREIQAIADSIPSWVDALPTYPRQSMAVWVDVGASSKAALQSEPATISIRCMAPVPLGIGSARAINSRYYFGPNLEIGVRQRGEHTAGEVIEIDRRLRLLPGEQIVVPVDPEIGMIGYLCEVGSDRPSRLRWRVIQGFETASTGSRDPGPGCVELTTKTVSREALPESRLEPARLIERLGRANDDEIPALLVAVRTRLLGGEVGGVPDASSSALVAALTQAYPTWSVTARILTAAMLPTPAVVAAVAPLEPLFREDHDPRVRTIAALTRVADPGDPVLRATIDGADPALASCAKRHAERLEAGVQTYSRVGARGAPVRLPK
ncbi:MAG: hypothetical protein HBSAPP03_29130 [Phycisphaerae bacterium]|nr:MAG: hypothetical protein HBSAPP03_29130 [Phycisphaerae bacterium]